MHLFFWTLLFIHRWRNPCSSRNLGKWLSERGSRLNKPIGRYISGNLFKLAFVIPTVFVWYSWILHVVFVVSPTVVPEYYTFCSHQLFLCLSFTGGDMIVLWYQTDFVWNASILCCDISPNVVIHQFYRRAFCLWYASLLQVAI